MRLDVKFRQTTNRFTLGFGEIQRVTILEVEKYRGEYDVIPKPAEQTLETKERFLEEDVRIKAIPFYEVGNTSGGDTVYIGTMDE